jgi:2-oxoglutarate dehydrogenase E2 component (dihydrolipoamide succinyltransferase)
LADVTLPDLGESVTEGIIIRWMKAVGDTVERDEPLYEVSTDKVDSEVPSPASGVLTSIVVPEGDTVAVGGTVCVIGDAGDAPAGTPASTAPSTTAEAASSPAASSTSPAASQPQRAASIGGSVTSPFVRRALAARRLSPSAVVATGPGGRLTRADVAAATVSRPVASLGAVDRPFPTGYVAIEATFDGVDAAMASHPELLSRTSFVVAAALEALQGFPELNGTVADDIFEESPTCHVGVEVELAGGLIIPVLRDAQTLGVVGIGAAIDAVVRRAETGTLDPLDLLGATFSVAASASSDVLFAVPALVGPQVASLGIGAVRRRPSVASSPDGDEAIVVRSLGVIGLSYDLRVVEPSRAAAFLSATASILDGTNWSDRL